VEESIEKAEKKSWLQPFLLGLFSPETRKAGG
jgi:hypothetical protein